MPEYQKDNIFVLPRDNLGYEASILMLEKSVGIHKMEVYGVFKKMRFLGQKILPRCLP